LASLGSRIPLASLVVDLGSGVYSFAGAQGYLVQLGSVADIGVLADLNHWQNLPWLNKWASNYGSF